MNTERKKEKVKVLSKVNADINDESKSMMIIQQAKMPSSSSFLQHHYTHKYPPALPAPLTQVCPR
jgi:hypothetical protein